MEHLNKDLFLVPLFRPMKGRRYLIQVLDNYEDWLILPQHYTSGLPVPCASSKCPKEHPTTIAYVHMREEGSELIHVWGVYGKMFEKFSDMQDITRRILSVTIPGQVKKTGTAKRLRFKRYTYKKIYKTVKAFSQHAISKRR